MPLFKGAEEPFKGVLFGGLAALNKAATTSLNKDKAVRAHKESARSFPASEPPPKRGRKNGAARNLSKNFLTFWGEAKVPPFLGVPPFLYSPPKTISASKMQIDALQNTNC